MPNARDILDRLVELSLLRPDAAREFDREGMELRDVLRELVRREQLTRFQAKRIDKGRIEELVLGNYVLLDELGAGGMGQVFLAEHLRMERRVALKVLPGDAAGREQAVARFRREVKAAAKLSHPNIVTAHDADEANGVNFLVMEHVEGDDLSSFVENRGPMSVELAVDCTRQAARGLEYAHQRGIVHRDVKPSNLLLDTTGVLKILDMGLARFDDALGNVSDQLTATGTVMGTLDFMSPEQAFDTRTADARSDVYSLGCTLYYLLHGRPMFGGDTVVQKILAHRDEAPPSLANGRVDVPGSLDDVYCRMVAKHPDERHDAMADVEEALTQAVAPSSARNVEARGSQDVGLTASMSAPLPDLEPAPRLPLAPRTPPARPGDPDTGISPPESSTVQSRPRLPPLPRTPPPTVPTPALPSAEPHEAKAGRRGSRGRAVRVVAVVACMILAVVAAAFELRRADRQRSIDRLVAENLGRIETISTCPGWLEGTFLEGHFVRVVRLEVATGREAEIGNLAFVGQVEELVLRGPTSLDFVDAMDSLVELELVEPRYNGKESRLLGQLRSLESLVIRSESPLVVRDTLEVLDTLPNLEALTLAGSTVRNSALEHLVDCRSLEFLDLSSTGIGDTGVETIANIETLQTVLLQNAKPAIRDRFGVMSVTSPRNWNAIGDESARSLARLPELRTLNLNNTGVGDDGASHLSRLGQLEALYLRNTRIECRGIQQLGSLETLERLDVSNHDRPFPILNDDCVRPLTNLTRLEALNLAGRYISPTARIRLSEAVPDAALVITVLP